MEDDQQRWQEEKGREPEWVRDICNLPWVVMVRKDGSIEIVSNDNRVICKMSDGSAEERALVAGVICDAVDKI
jgi:ribonuclease PH